MFATRIDQENLLHERAQAASSKHNPSKTPGKQTSSFAAPKTPFRVPLNDENAAGAAGKGENVKTVGKKLLNAAAYVTPAAAPGTKGRRALGAKTTNAKANPLLEASPLKSVAAPKSGSPRLKRPKIKVLQQQAETVSVNEEGAEEDGDGSNDVEYMPPRPEPMPDNYDDPEFPLNRPFPQLKPENLTRGWAEVYLNPLDSNGVSLLERRETETRAKQQAAREKALQEVELDVFGEIDDAVRRDLGLLPLPPATTTTTTTRKTSIASPSKKTQLSKSAATALSHPTRPASLAKPAGTSQATIRPSSRLLALGASNSHTTTSAAAAASRSTLGYARGRAVLGSQRTATAAAVAAAAGAAPRLTASRRTPVSSVFRDPKTMATGRQAKKPAAAGGKLLPSVVDEEGGDDDASFDKAVARVVTGLRMPTPQQQQQHQQQQHQQRAAEVDFYEDDAEVAGFGGAGLPDDDEWDGFELPLMPGND